jgi:hypothetical protein
MEDHKVLRCRSVHHRQWAKEEIMPRGLKSPAEVYVLVCPHSVVEPAERLERRTARLEHGEYGRYHHPQAERPSLAVCANVALRVG